MYNFTYSKKQPGIVFILCDLNKKIRPVYGEMIIAAQGIITEYLNGCSSGCNVKNRVFISVIGYGNQAPHVIKQGWADEWLCVMKDLKNNKKELFHEELGFIYDCHNVCEFIYNEMKNIIRKISTSPDCYNVLSPSIINITNRVPSDSELAAKKINELIAFTSQGNNVSVGHCILLNKYDNLEDVFLPTINIVPNSKLFTYWFQCCSVIENNYNKISCQFAPWRHIIMTHSGKHASIMANLTIGS